MPWLHEPWIRVYRGFDMGWWPDPAYCVWVVAVGQRLIAFKEKTWFKTPAKDIALDIVAESIGMHIVTTYCDPTLEIKTGNVETIKDIMEKEGLALDCAVNSRELFAHAINSALKSEVLPGVPRLQIYQPGCPYLAKYLPQMRYDENNSMAMADHRHDHGPIALAYVLMNVLPQTQPARDVRVMPWMKKRKHIIRHLHGKYN